MSFLRRAASRITQIGQHLHPQQTVKSALSTAAANMPPTGGSGSPANASGLRPDESRNLQERQPSDDEKPVLDALRQLYTVTHTERTFDVFSDKAIFHDPVGIAEGIPSIKAQFNALASLFPRAELTRFRLLQAPSSVPSSKLLVDQNVAYYRSKESDAKPFKELNSLLTIERNAEGKVVQHTEEWNHERTSSSENAGLLGSLNEMRKKATASVTHALASQTAPGDK